MTLSKRFFVALTLISILCHGCSTLHTEAQRSSNLAAIPVAPISCAGDATAQSFGLEPSTEVLEFQVTPTAKAGIPDPNSSIGLRLDICFGADDSVTLMRFLTKRSGFDLPEVFVLDDNGPVQPVKEIAGNLVFTTVARTATTVEGLKEAVFGDLTKLKISFPMEVNRVMSIERRIVDTHDVVLLATKSRTPANVWKLQGFRSLFGVLKSGDPFAGESLCPPDKAFFTSIFRIGTVKFKAGHCDGIGVGGGTHAYKIVSFAVQDDSEEIPVDQRGQWHDVPVADIFRVNLPALPPETAALAYASHHHDVCDSFVLKTLFAQYAVTSLPSGFPNVECKPALTLPDAPSWAGPSGGQLGYRIKYGSKPWSETKWQACSNPDSFDFFDCIPL